MVVIWLKIAKDLYGKTVLAREKRRNQFGFGDNQIAYAKASWK